MDLYTDNNKKTTLKGLGYKNRQTALETIRKVEIYFNYMKGQQKLPGWTPYNVLPKKYLSNKNESDRYYEIQKMYRILGMSNRAKGMVNRVKKNKGLKDAISVFKSWLDKYKNQKGGRNIESCCVVDEKNSNQCSRQSDGKIFNLPRKFSRNRCKEGARGFTMRSSCAPFKDC